MKDQLGEREIGYRSLEPGILLLQLLQALGLVDLQAAILTSPSVELCSDIPRDRQITPTFSPCESRTSASRSFAMICSGVYLFRLIPSSFFKVQNKPDPLIQPGPLCPGQVATHHHAVVNLLTSVTRGSP